MKVLTLVLLALVLIVGTACQKSSPTYSSADEIPVTESLEMSADMTDGSQAPVEIERMLIKTGQIEFETEDRTITRNRILELTKKNKGYVSYENDRKSTSRLTTNLSIRIPTAVFDSFLAEATKGVDHFDRKQIDIKDITEEFLDIEARLKTKKELEARYLELLQKATKVTEILEIEREIGTLRADIESIEGRMKYLQNQSSFSTIDFEFYKIISEHNRFGNKLSRGFKNGWDNLIWVFIYLINIWPFVLIFVAIIIFWRRRRQNKNGNK
jgi:hypothetical protein